MDGAGGHVAAIILPGDPLADQSAGGDDPGDYLEGENADGDAVFASCASDTCNDRVIGIRKDEIMAAVRRYVLGELRGWLAEYFDTNGHYPWAADLGDTGGSCDNRPDGAIATAARCSQGLTNSRRRQRAQPLHNPSAIIASPTTIMMRKLQNTISALGRSLTRVNLLVDTTQ